MGNAGLFLGNRKEEKLTLFYKVMKVIFFSFFFFALSICLQSVSQSSSKNWPLSFACCLEKVTQLLRMYEPLLFLSSQCFFTVCWENCCGFYILTKWLQLRAEVSAASACSSLGCGKKGEHFSKTEGQGRYLSWPSSTFTCWFQQVCEECFLKYLPWVKYAQ